MAGRLRGPLADNNVTEVEPSPASSLLIIRFKIPIELVPVCIPQHRSPFRREARFLNVPHDTTKLSLSTVIGGNDFRRASIFRPRNAIHFRGRTFNSTESKMRSPRTLFTGYKGSAIEE